MHSEVEDPASVDSPCIERLANAVESLLLRSELPKGLESAVISIVPLDPADFPTARLSNLFSQIMQRHQKAMEQYHKTNPPARHPALSYLRYAAVPARTKHWFKQRIWTLFRESLAHNEICRASA